MFGSYKIEMVLFVVMIEEGKKTKNEMLAKKCLADESRYQGELIDEES